MLHVTVLRSPFAHAKITMIDTSEAKNQPGVVEVFTGDDLAEDWDKNPQANPASVTGYGLSLDQRVQQAQQEGASVSDTPETAEEQPLDERSEERRAGKECRSRWSPVH